MTYESEYFLVSLDDSKSYLDIDDTDDDAIIGYLMNVVSKLFDTVTGRTLIAADLTEYYQGDGTDTLYLRSYPVNSTTSEIEVYIDEDRLFDADTKQAAANLWIDSDMGRLVHEGRELHKDEPVKVVYNAGYAQDSVPYDLRLAALEWLGVLYKRKQEGRFDVNTLSRGDVSYTYLDTMPHTVRDVLRRYERRG